MSSEDAAPPRRFRSFVARPAPPPAPAPAPSPTEAPAADAEPPTLTEIVTPDSAASVAETIDPAALRAALADSLNHWLDETLPQLLEKLEHGTRQEL